MRLLLMWPSSGPATMEFIKELNQSPHRVVYWLGHHSAASDAAREFPEIIFHSHAAAERVEPAAGVDTRDFLPPSEALINSLTKVESLILTMLNRFYDTMCVDERRHIYYKMLTYWVGVLDKYQPEAIIFPVDPHWVFDFLVFELARRRGLKTFMFSETKISDRILWMEDFRAGSAALLAAQARNAGKNFSLSDISDDIVKYYQPRASASYNELPGHIDFLKKKHSWRYRWLHDSKIIKSFKDGSFFKRARIWAIRWWQNDRKKMLRQLLVAGRHIILPNLKKEYAAVAKPPDWGKKFVYLALQVQPERTTSPLGDIFCDQLLVAEIVSAALPPNWIIYVKEHPIQWLRIGIDYSSNRYPGYYKKLAAIPNVQVVPVETNTYELNNKSEAVVTVTGSPGLEALLRSKPVIIFGYPWYKDCPGVFRVNSVDSCRYVFNKIIEGYRFDQQVLINYLKSLDEATIRGFIAQSNAKASTFNQAQSLHNMAELIRSELARK
ncbi:MAG: hypothetical protein EXS55_04265 [Candidatus Magasanikbacteria bacterium]|nr:hypothetical protein [Candidatus Magasanikbacteria bacterium]